MGASRLLVALLLMLAPCARAQATRVMADTASYLLQITQEWGRKSPLGRLTALSMQPEDIEVRFWEGYGLAGEWGVVLRRHGGRWRAWDARIVRCNYSVPIPVGDTLSPTSVAHYQRLARARCAEQDAGEHDGPPGTNGWTLISDDTVALTPIAPRAPLGALWSHAVHAGIAELPLRVPRPWVMTDGHTYVVELRRGNEYRASVIEQTRPPATAADTAVQAVAAIIHRLSRSK